MLVALDMDEHDDGAVPIPNVNATILKTVIHWATYHKDGPLPEDDENTDTEKNIDIGDWDNSILRVDQAGHFV